MLNFYCNSRRFAVLLLTICIPLQFIHAQGTGSIRGKILDQTNGEGLIGANIVVQNSNIGAAADIDGNFYIHNVPAGPQVLIVSYIGFISQTVQVNVVEGRTLEVSYELSPRVLEGEEVVITGQAQGQLSAINQQFSSNTIANVVSKDRIKELPDVNAAETIGRLPGVSIERSGGEANKISIRGLQPKYNAVTVNGVRIPATGAEDRSVDLSLISSNMLDGITLKKANTPDMDA
ncbi:MAG: carboxypeptidase-like regulatory domain-containing protein, partial [Ignavibacteriaceae bacterium]